MNMKRQQIAFLIALVMMKICQLSSAPTEPNGQQLDTTKDDQKVVTGERLPANVAYLTSGDDFGTAGVIFQFQRNIKSDNIEANRRSSLDKNFMRFGRGGSGNLIRYGRSPRIVDNDDDVIPSKSIKNDKNYFRFGRSGSFMRFGRNYNEPELYDDYKESLEDEEDFMDRPSTRGEHKHDELGRNVLRLGRPDPDGEDDGMMDIEDAKMFEKRGGSNMMRFGRANLMRFGRGGSNMMRFGRSNTMRFGRSDMLFSREARGDKNLMRLGRSGHMRFGRNEKNIMRFGKRSDSGVNNGNQETAKFLCKDERCLIDENENGLQNNRELTGGEEYFNEK